MTGVASYYLEFKARLRDRVSALLGDSEREEALRDPHSKRKPRPCGFTIHTGIGCTMGCLYCYIGDMGFPIDSIKPYPLSGVQLVYALLNNRYFLPGREGSLIALGSVTEPLHPAVLERTLEYIEAVKRYMGNHIQFSTKAYVSKTTAAKLAEIDPGISPLVTIVSLRYSSILERNAPKPDLRFESIRTMSEAGLKPLLFLRPVIPGITEWEFEEIIDEAAEHGAIGVVAGGLRVSRGIIDRLRDTGVDLREIEKRIKIPLGKLRAGVQYGVEVSDIKEKIAAYARRKGLKYFPSACMANLYTHGETCWRMISLGLEGQGSPLREPSKSSVEEALRDIGCSGFFKGFSEGYIIVEPDRGCDIVLAGELLRCWFKACVRFSKSRGKCLEDCGGVW
ncbi:radical SAM protein [Desulfurococcus mucosus]|uniref:Radical SAM domain protein n=2 Tax=Desulfurococcus mucosus TaxID=2275 RepID=E8R9I5_DESM0|nr:radical SAM protein [Desulfurococcus mucosus]ADV65161.1 Radical SAM domain protein [Desulfurococcus mucosus DSM 2162]